VNTIFVKSILLLLTNFFRRSKSKAMPLIILFKEKKKMQKQHPRKSQQIPANKKDNNSSTITVFFEINEKLVFLWNLHTNVGYLSRCVENKTVITSLSNKEGIVVTSLGKKTIYKQEKKENVTQRGDTVDGEGIYT